jgi:hypothetical protein
LPLVLVVALLLVLGFVAPTGARLVAERQAGEAGDD